MNTNIKNDNNKSITEATTEVAKTLFKIEQLPEKEKIAAQYYIKGIIEGIQIRDTDKVGA